VSKRNRAFLRGGVVYKQLQTAAAAARESEILRRLRRGGAAVPTVLACQGKLLTLEYLPGQPLPDVLHSGNYCPERLALALCDWFAGFYAASFPGEVRDDANGRNFLYDGKHIYGVDFERRRYGPRALDAGRLTAFLETYGTTAPQRQRALIAAFAALFGQQFGCTFADILEQRTQEFRAMAERRQTFGGATGLDFCDCPQEKA
jgi:tRNA A-37 threonylcarbamoyl transferase component Bud32